MVRGNLQGSSSVGGLNGLMPLSINQGFEYFTHCIEVPINWCEPNLSNSEFNNINGLPGTYATHPGQWRMRLLDNSASRAVMQQANPSGTRNILFGGGAWIFETMVNIGVLSTATNEYIIEAGFTDARTNAVSANGALWEYDRTNSVNWIAVTENSSTRTEIDSGIAVSTGTSAWVTLRIEVNAAGNSIEFFINGVSSGISTTNIPTGGNMQYFIRAQKSASNASQNTMYIDYIYIRNELTTEI